MTASAGDKMFLLLVFFCVHGPESNDLVRFRAVSKLWIKPSVQVDSCLTHGHLPAFARWCAEVPTTQQSKHGLTD